MSWKGHAVPRSQIHHVPFFVLERMADEADLRNAEAARLAEWYIQSSRYEPVQKPSLPAWLSDAPDGIWVAWVRENC